MNENELLALAQDQLEIACENLVNQKDKASEAYKTAAFEVQSCLNALKAVENSILTIKSGSANYKEASNTKG